MQGHRWQRGGPGSRAEIRRKGDKDGRLVVCGVDPGRQEDIVQRASSAWNNRLQKGRNFVHVDGQYDWCSHHHDAAFDDVTEGRCGDRRLSGLSRLRTFIFVLVFPGILTGRTGSV